MAVALDRLSNTLDKDRYIQENTVILTDIEGNWAKESIQNLVDIGVISGYSNHTFKPDSYTTRAELIKMLNNLMQLPTDYYNENTFVDLSGYEWHYDDMMRASNTSYEIIEVTISMMKIH